MTDDKIIKALECCLCDNSECLQCQNKELCRIECDELDTKTIDLITRQQAENETLKALNGRLVVLGDRFRSELKTAKAEAYKEFAEKAKEFMHNKFKALDEYEFEYITERDIDNLLKEMVGENNDL